jgi:ketosteroid isomerase-like protein
MTERDPALQELLDKQAIREVVMRYCRGVDRGDVALVESVYHPDAVDERHGEISRGAEMGKLVHSMLASMQSTNHQITTQTIEVHGDTGAAESYSAGSHVMRDGQRLRTLVRYLDRFERRAGEWRIIHRTMLLDGAEVLPPLEGTFGPAGAESRRDRDDPSYAFLDH